MNLKYVILAKMQGKKILELESNIAQVSIYFSNFS